MIYILTVSVSFVILTSISHIHGGYLTEPLYKEEVDYNILKYSEPDKVLYTHYNDVNAPLSSRNWVCEQIFKYKVDPRDHPLDRYRIASVKVRLGDEPDGEIRTVKAVRCANDQIWFRESHNPYCVYPIIRDFEEFTRFDEEVCFVNISRSKAGLMFLRLSGDQKSTRQWRRVSGERCSEAESSRVAAAHRERSAAKKSHSKRPAWYSDDETPKQRRSDLDPNSSDDDEPERKNRLPSRSSIEDRLPYAASSSKEHERRKKIRDDDDDDESSEGKIGYRVIGTSREGEMSNNKGSFKIIRMYGQDESPEECGSFRIIRTSGESETSSSLTSSSSSSDERELFRGAARGTMKGKSFKQKTSAKGKSSKERSKSEERKSSRGKTSSGKEGRSLETEVEDLKIWDSPSFDGSRRTITHNPSREDRKSTNPILRVHSPDWDS